MSTGRDLVTAALRKIGAIAPRESLSAEEANDALSEFNRMIDSWSNDKLTIFAITEESPLALTGGQSSYTLGAGGDITTRPMEIVSAVIRDGQTDYPVELITENEFVGLFNKSVTSVYPQMLYDDGGFPQRKITLYPTPSASKNLILWTKRPLAALTLDSTVSFPPGYEDALIFNGAVRLAPEYGRPVTQEIAQVAIDTLAAIKRGNHRSILLQVDEALINRGGRFNIFTGEYNR